MIFTENLHVKIEKKKCLNAGTVVGALNIGARRLWGQKLPHIDEITFSVSNSGIGFKINIIYRFIVFNIHAVVYLLLCAEFKYYQTRIKYVQSIFNEFIAFRTIHFENYIYFPIILRIIFPIILSSRTAIL